MKNSRQSVILDLVEENDIRTQEELAALLREAGFTVTQATVSRDIKELRLVKVLSAKGGYKYAASDPAVNGLADRFARIFADSVLSIASAGNIIVVKTLAASANAAAEAVDSMHMTEVLGTMAGDNTILVIVHNEQEAVAVAQRLQTMLR